VGQADVSLPIIHLTQFPCGYQYVKGAMDKLESILQSTWIELSAMTLVSGVMQQVCSKKVKAEHSFHRIMEVCPKWCKALAYLCVFLRILICCGHTNNSHLLISANYAECRLELIHSIWPKCLDHANILSHDLETGGELFIAFHID
jgi:hypothetical protein